MKKITKYITSGIGLAFVSLFCVGATTGMTFETGYEEQIFSEPMSLVFAGVMLLGIAGLMNSWRNRQ